MLVKPLVRPIVRAIAGNPTASLGSGFSPTSLFLDGSKGVVYDNNDFVDSATWRRNLFTYTEDFSNAAWSKTNNVQVAANAGIAPDGTNTAWKLSSSISTNGIHDMRFTVPVSPSNTKLTHSIYVKASDYGSVGFISYGSSATDNAVFSTTSFDLATGAQIGAVTNSGGGRTYNVVNVGSGWWRIDFTSSGASSSATAITFVIALIPDVGSQLQTLAIGQGILIWHPQIEVGTAPTTYQRITDFNSDFLAAFPGTTLFLDSAGTTPATVNGLVGLQLDKSQGLVLGAELCAIGVFDSATGWTVPTGWTVSGGVATASATSASLLQTGAIVSANKWYKVEFDWTHVSGTLAMRVGTGPQATFTTSGHKVVYLLSSNTAGVEFYGGVVTGTLDNVSVVELAGNHRYQTTTGSKPVLRGTPTGANLVTNGDFASGTTGWTLEAGWAVGSGVATTTGDVSKTIYQTTNQIVSGKTYRVTYTISGATANAIRINVKSPADNFQTGYINSNGTVVTYFTATVSGAFGLFNFTGGITVDNIEVVDVSAGSVTAPYGLQYDGVDDFMQTAAVDFTATDKMFVCAGVRKLSDAAVGRLVEFSASVAANAGSFGFSAPASVAANYEFRCGGSIRISTGYTNALVAAPNTAVLTGIGDIAGDNVQISTNGVLRTSANNDQGTGTCGNYPFYFGRRGGTVDPYNGLDFGMVICGKTLTSTQISQAERYIAQRTGVTI